MPVEKDLYFDWAGTAIPDQEILQDALKKSLECWGNPSSLHDAGKKAREALEEARARAAKVLGCKPQQIFWTSGGTESDHIPLLSILNRPERGNILVSSIEHPAMREMAAALKHTGVVVKQIPCNKDGIITPEAVSALMDEDTLFVAVMAVNNETGAIQPVAEIASAITEKTKGKRQPKFHVDAVQALGKIPVNLLSWEKAGVDSAAFSAHKICGPRGIGILYLKNPVEPFLRGGGQEGGIRSGTENLFGATAFASCLERYAITKENGLSRLEEQKKMAEAFIKGLLKIRGAGVIPALRAINPGDQRFSPWVVQASFEKIPGQVMLRALNARGICISTGSACSAKKASRPILEAMGVDASQRENSVRFSFGQATTQAGLDALLKAVEEIAKDFAVLSPFNV